MPTNQHPRRVEVRQPDGTIHQYAPESGGICDFCSMQLVVWCYPATSFFLEPQKWGSIGNWAACTACSDLIEAGDLTGLTRRCSDLQTIPVERALGRRVTRAESEQHAATLATLHAQFMVNRCGDRHPIHPMPPEGIVGPHDGPGTGAVAC